MSESNNVVAWVILGYLCSHPYAKDTAAGIARWWLAAEGVEAEIEAVAVALDYLVVWGWLTMVNVSSGHRMYGLNQVRREALQRFIRTDDHVAPSKT